jgi:hypothetical protein
MKSESLVLTNVSLLVGGAPLTMNVCDDRHVSSIVKSD